MLLAFKTELDLNNKQRSLAAQHAGVARHAYNWGLAICKQALENKQKLPSAIDLHKRLVAEVKKENPWYYQVSKCAPQEALRNLERGIKRWRQGLGRFPVFKKNRSIRRGSDRTHRVPPQTIGPGVCVPVSPGVTPEDPFEPGAHPERAISHRRQRSDFRRQQIGEKFPLIPLPRREATRSFGYKTLQGSFCLCLGP